jgi:hypothetical protein
MHGDRQPPAAAGVSKVLDDDDLVIKILLRVGFPTTLVRAALVCKRWLGHASDRAFLRRFRELHPPRLLGFYIEELGIRSPSFVPMLPQPPELAAVIRHASFVLDARAYRTSSMNAGTAASSSPRTAVGGKAIQSTARCRGALRDVCPRATTRPVLLLQAGHCCSFSQALSKEDQFLLV